MKTGSPYAKIIPGSTATTDVIFTHANVAPGTFNLERTGARINSKILLNSHNNDCFQRGIPHIADSIEGAADWLRGKIRDLGGSYLRIIGLSAGAAAAIVFGELLNADAVISISPEIVLGIPRYRSHDWNPEKHYHARLRDVTPFLATLGQRLSVVLPAWDVSDFRQIYAVSRIPEVNLILVPDMHSGTRQMDWKRITAAPGAVDLAKMALNGVYDWRLSAADLVLGIAAFEAIGRDDGFANQIFSTLRGIDPENPGLAYRSAVQKVLLGHIDQATWLWRLAEPSIATTTLSLKARYPEYRNWLREKDFARLSSFVSSLPPVSAHSQPPVNMMAAW